MGIRWPDHSSKSPTGYRAQGCIVSSKLVSRLGLNVRPSEDEAVGIRGLNVPDIRGQTNFEFTLGSTCTGVSYQVSAVVLDEVVGKLLRLGYHQRLETSGPTRRDPVLYGSVLSEVLQRFWESEEPPTADRRKPEDDECELFYQYNTERCPSGRFVTRLPFLPNRPALAYSFELGATDIVFHLYTRNNPQVSEPLLPTIDSIATSNQLVLARRTVITIHSNGERGVDGNFNAFAIPAHLAAEDVNVIAVDWINGARMYSQGLGNAPQVGEVIANFINILSNPFGYDPSLIRIVGHGLGGHIAGIAARKVNGAIPHIVAIDPSFVGWTHHPDILSPDAAGVVEVLHATAGTLGYDYPLGDLDFYPNGGSNQNGCGADSSCSHTYAYAFYAESLTSEVNGGNSFVGTKCDSYGQAVIQACSGEQDVVFGGSAVKSGVSGIYTFQTNFAPPFARG
ncbi:lipase domain-containing protein [Phthorimaea operculella]|nr:lipase domain-containing protein [Phthorimaea operculella]